MEKEIVHITDRMIAEWIDLPSEEQDRGDVAVHIATCDECRSLALAMKWASQEAAQAEFEGDVVVPEVLTLRATSLMRPKGSMWREKLARWAGAATKVVEAIKIPIPQTQPVFARGLTKSGPQHYRAGDVDITLSISPDEGGRWLVAGSVLDSKAEMVALDRGVLIQQNQQVHISDLDSWGEFVVAGVEAGIYTVSIVHNGDAIVLTEVEIGQN